MQKDPPPRKISMSNFSNLWILSYLEKGVLQIAIKLRILKWDNLRLWVGSESNWWYLYKRYTEENRHTEAAVWPCRQILEWCTRGHKANNVDSYQILGELARNGFSSTACRGSAALLSSRFQTCLQDRENNCCWFKQPSSW